MCKKMKDDEFDFAVKQFRSLEVFDKWYLQVPYAILDEDRLKLRALIIQRDRDKKLNEILK